VKHELVREHVPTELLASKEIWNQLFRKMPMMAMLRSLGKMSKQRLGGSNHIVFYIL
jgi:60 kDa SS-A/Ro ribonucleoprotein